MIHLVVALPGEARPLVAAFGLRSAGDSGAFRLFEGEATRLVVSGVGKVAAAAATAYLHLFAGGHRNQGWINLGVAGHTNRPLGQGVLAHKITDQGSGRSWYPPLAFPAPCETAAVLTVDRPEERYLEDWVYDMEASGFYPTACRFSTSELVHCFKVISDNRESPPREVSVGRVERIMEENLETIRSLVAQVRNLAEELGALDGTPAELEEILGRWRFSVSQERKLRRLLRRWWTLNPGQRLALEDLATETSAAAVLRTLEERLRGLPVMLPRS